jgi:2-hydroxychromene-2-carboxylate isomerase
VGAPAPVFYYDLGSPECYLAAERIMSELPMLAEWEPVRAPELTDRAPDRQDVERRAAELGMPALRWPVAWPPDTLIAMLTATYAKQIGRGVPFSLAAFRQAFAGGSDLGDQDTVLIAGAACEMHPTAVIRALKMRSVIDALAGATAGAQRAGVDTLPAIRLGALVFSGPDAVERAAVAIAQRADPP